MRACNYCNSKLDGLPYHCRRCGGYYCDSHRLPENHSFPGLQKGNIFNKLSGRSRKRNFYEVNEAYRRERVPSKRHESSKTQYHKEKRSYFNRAKGWLNSRSHRRFSNWNALLFNLLWLVITTLGILIIYSNIKTLNQTVIWFLPLGGILLLILGGFWIKYVWKFLKKIYYWYRGERNWMKYFLLILLIILLFNGYAGEITFPEKEDFNSINFSSIFPIAISEDIPEESILSKRSITSLVEEVKQEVSEVVNSDPVTQETMELEKEILRFTNVERRLNGLPALRWDSKLALIAREHSLDMAENDFFDHDNLRGESPTDRARRHNYNVIKQLDSNTYSEGIAENIGSMPTGNVAGHGYVSNNPEAVGEAQVLSWMNSQGHRANILESQYGVLGVGCAYDGLYYVCTQNFK